MKIKIEIDSCQNLASLEIQKIIIELNNKIVEALNSNNNVKKS